MNHVLVTQGGMPGAERLRDNQVLDELLNTQISSKRLYSAMCAAPAVVFESKGFLTGKKATAHPAFVETLTDAR